jgi:hypothetical protein
MDRVEEKRKYGKQGSSEAVGKEDTNERKEGPYIETPRMYQKHLASIR